MTLTYARAETEAGCYRCGYPLVGIADDQPCPECGLLAIRSRRPSDDLRFVRPRWLRRMRVGVLLITMAFLWPWVWGFGERFLNALAQQLVGPPVSSLWAGLIYEALPWSGVLGTAGLLLAGAKLLTTPEGYAPADAADRVRRRWLVISATVPVAVLIAAVFIDRQMPHARWQPNYTAADFSFYGDTVGVIPFTLLLFFQLRGLAKRARSAWLAEHCIIVGVGTSITMLCFAGYYYWFVQSSPSHIRRIGWAAAASSTAWMLLSAFLGAFLILFYLWALLLLLRFSFAFRAAGRELKQAWVRDDRSIEPAAIDRP